MDIRPIGDDLEAVCVGCGEVMLLMSGDAVDVRIGPSANVGGIAMPRPQGLLCSACNRKENSGSTVRVSLKFFNMSCADCGKEIDPNDDFDTKMDDEGEISGVVCSDCSEPWRGSCEAS